VQKITVFKSWTTWERSLRFKYRSTTLEPKGVAFRELPSPKPALLHAFGYAPRRRTKALDDFVAILQKPLKRRRRRFEYLKHGTSVSDKSRKTVAEIPGRLPGRFSPSDRGFLFSKKSKIQIFIWKDEIAGKPTGDRRNFSMLKMLANDVTSVTGNP
jgi:hypothetical protein